MAPAMDRAPKMTPERRFVSSLGLGISLAAIVLDLGCSQLPWKKPAAESPMLGRIGTTTDIYAMNRKPDLPTDALGTMMAGTVLPEAPMIARSSAAEESGTTVPPADSVEIPPIEGVGSQPTDSNESRPMSRAAAGVPNASLLLASSERRTSVANSSPGAAEIVAEARTVLNSLANYEVSMHRQERVNGSLLPEEDVTLAIRREPKAVRLSWSDGPNQGREVLYRADEAGAPMHVKMANPALPRLKLSPESPMVMRNSRHPVTEAGFDSIVEALEEALKDPQASGITYAGLESIAGFEQTQHCLTRTASTGERWRIYLDPKTHLPSLVQATDAGGELLERYLFRGVRPNVPELTANDAFDANARWGQPRGLFGRIARGEPGEASSTATPSPR